MSSDSGHSSPAPPLPLDQLLAALTPGAPLHDLSRQLASRWGECFQLERCCLLSRSLRGLEGIEWHRENRILPLQIGITTTSSGSLAWRPPPGPDTDVSIGVAPASAWERIPADWMTLTVFLLRSARYQDELLRDQKLASLAEFAAGAGHEVNNPLGSIIGRTSQLLREETDPRRKQLLETIGAQAYRIRDMIGDTMLFARPPAPQPQSVDLVDLLRRACDRMQPQAEGQGVDLEFTSDLPEASVVVDPDQISIVVTELIRNAIDACSAGGRVHLACLPDVARNGRPGVAFQVTDDGTGLTEEQWKHCFDPFYSGRSAGRGLGFGLSKCWRIVQQHGGRIDLVREGEQTRGTVWLPRSPESGPTL